MRRAYTLIVRSCFVSILAAAAVFSHAAFASVPVSVDGERVVVHPGATVSDAAGTRLTSARGDLVAASDGRVLVDGGGRSARAYRNRKAASEDEVLRPGDRVDVKCGDDVREQTIEQFEAIPIPTKVVGSGALLTLAAPGSAGVMRVVVGSVSGDVVESETIRPAEPMVLRRVIDESKKKVALTFDDGPWPKQTDAILRILASEGVPATFFVIGRQVRANPGIVRRITSAGHAIGNHTYHHVDLVAADDAHVWSEIAGTSRAIRAVADVTPRWLRPPGGAIDADAYDAAAKQGMRVVLWTVDPQDWKKGVTAAQIEAEVVRAVRPGAVILLHDGGGDRRETIAALPGIIKKLRAKGYEFVPLARIGAVKTSW